MLTENKTNLYIAYYIYFSVYIIELFIGSFLVLLQYSYWNIVYDKREDCTVNSLDSYPRSILRVKVVWVYD